MSGATSAALNTVNVQNAVQQQADKNLFRQAAMKAAQGDPSASAQPMAPSASPAAPEPVQLAGPGAEQPVDPAAAARQPNIPMGAAGGGQNVQAIHQLFGVHTAGHKDKFDYNYFGRLLESQGRPDLAAGAYKMGRERVADKVGMQLQLMDFIGRAAPLVTDQASLDALRQNLSTLGLDGALPQQFTPDLQQQLMMMGSKSLQQLELKLKEKHEASDDKHKRAQEKRWEEQSRIEKEKAAKDNQTTAAKKHKELTDAGWPEDIARGRAYGGIKFVQDPLGLGGILVNENTGQKMGAVKNGKFIPEPGVYSGSGARPPFNPKNFMTSPGAPPPVTGNTPPPSPFMGMPPDDEEGT